MRIAYFSDAFLPSINGVVTSLMALTETLGNQGHSVAIFFPTPANGREITWKAKNVELFSVPSVPSLVYPDFRIGAPSPQTLLTLRSFKPDVIHVQSPGTIGLQALLAGKLLKVPLLGTFHVYFMESEYLQLINLSQFTGISRALWRYTIEFYNRCSMVIPLSSSIAQDLKKHGLKTRMQIIPNGINLDPIQKVSAKTVDAFRRKHRLSKTTILYVGRVSKEKSLDVLISAFEKVAERVDEAQLVLIGDGPMRKELQELATQMGISERVRFLGNIPHTELLASGAYQAASIFCTPSTSEVQPISIIEAMAAGLPIVGVKSRGMKDLVNGNGILIRSKTSQAMAKAILTLLNSSGKLQRASNDSLLVARKYAIGEVARQMEQLYISVQSKSPQP